MKKCGKCGRWLVANTVNFHRNKKGKYGLASKCKECCAEYNKQYRKDNRDKIAEQKKQYIKRYYEANRDKLLERKKQYRKDNRDKVAEYYKQYYQDNKEKKVEYHKQYYQDNRDKMAEQQKRWSQTPSGQSSRFNSNNKRRLKEEQLGIGITKGQWLEMMSFFDFRCAYSGETLTKDTRSVDHIVPLNSNGDNMIWNCVPMLRSLNSSKHDKDMLEWYRKQDFYDTKRLDKIYEWQEYAFNKWYKEEK